MPTATPLRCTWTSRSLPRKKKLCQSQVLEHAEIAIFKTVENDGFIHRYTYSVHVAGCGLHSALPLLRACGAVLPSG